MPPKATRAPRAPKEKPAGAKRATGGGRKRKARPEAGSVGLTAAEVASGAPSPEVARVRKQIEDAGGAVLAAYREPFGGHWVTLAALPLDQVAPTPYQRELSKAHADRLAAVIPKVGRFLDPVIAVAAGDGAGQRADGAAQAISNLARSSPAGSSGPARFISPNGMHRLAALAALGAKAVVALVIPEPEIAFRILALNTEKAHNLKDKALEVIRMARAIAADGKRSEADVAFELEQASLVTLGICYEKNGRFSGGAYNPVVSRTEVFSAAPMAESLELRAAHADKLLELDEAVTAAVGRLKEAGFTSGYLKPIVVARVNPLRFVKAGKDDAPPDFDRTIDRMIEGARKFDPAKVRAQDVAIAAAVGGAAEE